MIHRHNLMIHRHNLMKAEGSQHIAKYACILIKKNESKVMPFYVIFSYVKFLPKFNCNVSYILTNKIFGETILLLIPFQTHTHVYNDTTVFLKI